jgi:hypothetical protein
MVLVEVGTVVVLTTGHTTTTGVLTVLSDTTVTGGHMTAARWKKELVSLWLSIWHSGDGVFCSWAFPAVARRRNFSSYSLDLFPTELSAEFSRVGEKGNRELATHCFLVFDKRVGILSTVLCSTSVVGDGDVVGVCWALGG